MRQQRGRRVAKIGVIPLQYLEGSFSQLTAAQASLAYDESLVIVDAAVSAPGHGLERTVPRAQRKRSHGVHVRQFWFALLIARSRDRVSALNAPRRDVLTRARDTRTHDPRPPHREAGDEEQRRREAEHHPQTPHTIAGEVAHVQRNHPRHDGVAGLAAAGDGDVNNAPVY